MSVMLVTQFEGKERDPGRKLTINPDYFSLIRAEEFKQERRHLREGAKDVLDFRTKTNVFRALLHEHLDAAIRYRVATKRIEHPTSQIDEKS